MPREYEIEHKRILDLRIPYQSFNSPTASNISWQAGANCYANSKGFLERRPGFGAAVEPTPTAFGKIQRIFTWRRWPGTTNEGYYIMVSSLESGVAKVYKFLVGTDTSAVAIWTSASAEPFDFIEANNHVFFGNGTDMKKYDGADVRNWGIVKPAAPPAVAASDASVVNAVTIRPAVSLNGWASNAHVGDYEGGVNQGHTWGLNADTTYPYGTPEGAVDGDDTGTWAGISYAGTHKYAGCIWSFTYTGDPLNTPKLSVKSTVSPGLRSAGMWYSLDGGISWRQIYNGKARPVQWDVVDLPDGQDINLIQVMAFADSHDDLSHYVYDIKVTGTTTSVVYGYRYRYTYGNSKTRHESSSSQISSFTIGNSITVAASTDPQVDEIHVYRTTINGSTNPSKMQELPNSPFTNADQTLTDTASDVDLKVSYCPGEYSNDPPTPSMGFVWAQQRIWSFKNNTLYYSGYEEIIKGVPEESFPSSVDGNYRPYKREIHALTGMANGVDIMTALTKYGVEGDTLDTLRWGTLLEKRGTKWRAAVQSLGSTILWLDTSKQLWNSDAGEVGLDIRPNLAQLDDTAALALHISGEYHWLIVQDSTNSKLWVLNLDTNQWQVPWTVKSTAIHSGETADGTVDLLIGWNGTRLCKLTPGTFQDNGAPYDAWVRGNLFDLSGDKQAGRSAVVDYIEVERNDVLLMDVKQLSDDATTYDGYVSIFANEQDPPLRQQGQQIIAKRYMSQPDTGACKRASFELHWGINSYRFELYTIDVAYHPANR